MQTGGAPMPELNMGNERPTRTRLCDFVRSRQDRIIILWTERVRTLSPVRETAAPAIVDHLPDILARMADFIESVHTGKPVSLADGPRAHAVDRLARGFDLSDVVREYSLLRHCILDLWKADIGRTIDVDESQQFDLAIDEALEHSIARFASGRERVLRALNQISDAALGTEDLDEFLQHLLKATLELTESVNTAVVLLRDKDMLRVRAAVGLEEELESGFTIPIGEGFAGTIAATREPLFLRHAASDPLVKSTAIRDKGVRALYGVPLSHGQQVLGVAHIGSRTAFEFSDEDKLLFRTMANRATAVIVQAQLVADRKRVDDERMQLLERERRAREDAERIARDLAERELEFRTLADNIPQLAWMTDETGFIFWYNQRWFEFTGTTLEEMRGWGWQKVHHPEHLPRVLEKFRDHIQRGIAWEDSFPLRAKDGSYRWFLSRAIPIRDESGRIVRWFGTNTDITEQRATEEALRDAETRFRLAVEATELGTWDCDPQTGAATWSSEMKAIFGVAPDFQPYRGFVQERTHPDDRKPLTNCLQRALGPTGDGRFDLDYRIRRVSDGAERWIAARGRVLFDERRQPIRILGTTLDITKRKQAEDAQRFLSDATALLAASLDYPKTLHEIAHLAVPRLADWCAVALVERDGSVRQVAVAHTDPARVELARDLGTRYPVDPNAPVGVPAVIRSGKPELARDIPDELLVRVARDEEHLRIIRELGLKSYMVVPMIARDRVLGAITLVSAESGHRYDEGDLAYAQHLARRAALAIDNARLYEEAREATRLREQVLAIVSHDLRNPLGAIQMSSTLLAKRFPGASTDPRLRRHVDTIQRSAGRMERLISDLLDVASIQAGRLAVELKDEPLGPIIDEAVEMRGPAAIESGISLRTEIDRSLFIRADHARMLQVFGNLLGNAIKFCRSGDSITLRAEPKAREVVFSIGDTGPGISAEEAVHVFDPYWSAQRHARKGTGLGLFITKGIVEAHGGRIWVESKPRKGSTFFFTVPLGRRL